MRYRTLMLMVCLAAGLTGAWIWIVWLAPL
jgi:hypothetical protein